MGQNLKNQFNRFLTLGICIALLALTGACASRSSSEASYSTIDGTVEQTGLDGQPIPLSQSDLIPVTVSFAQVAEELGIPQGRMKEQILVLARFLSQKKLPKNYCVEERESTEKICALIEALREDNPDLPSSRARVRARALRASLIPELQEGSLDNARVALRSVSSLITLDLVPEMLKTSSCPRNLSVAAVRDIEAQLPSNEVRESIERLYVHASECLKPSDDGYEITHLRQALLRNLWGEKRGAKESIKLALAAQQIRERHRVWYWAGVIFGPAKDGKQYWDLLVKNHPLSFHALEVWRNQGVDPYQIITSRPLLQLNREVIGNDQAFDAMRWVEALYIKEYTSAAEKLTLWMGARYRANLVPSNMMYLSALKSQKGTALNVIRFISNNIGIDSDMLNQQTLTMLFPKPYFEIFDKAATRTDVYLIMAVARQESGFNPMARSSANARGILQLLPGTARMLSGHRKNDLYNPNVNVPLGVKFVSQLIEKFGSAELALAAYNAGPGRIPSWVARYPSEDPLLFMDLIPFRETRDYVSNILRNNYWYHRLYGDEKNGMNFALALKDKQRSELVSRLVETHRTISHARDPAVSVR